MWVTLAGGFVTAITDPLFIFGFGLGVYGAAWAIVVSRLVYLGVGAWAAFGRPPSCRRPRLIDARRDFRPIMAIGLPAILANLATPVAAIYITRVWSDFGEATVAGGAIVDRVIPLAFAVIFALTGSIGPIIGQNFGARLLPRVKRTLGDALIVAVGYALCAWAALAARRRSSTPSTALAPAPNSSTCSAASERWPGCSSPASSSPIRPSTTWAFPCSR